MSIWLRFGDRPIRWEGSGLPGGPPVLVPPAWALVERIWETIGAPLGPAVIEPDSWLDEAIAGLPADLARLRLCLVVPDATRSGPFLFLIPPLLERLGNLSFAERTLLVATGTHRARSIQEVHDHLTSAAQSRASGDVASGPGWTDWSRWRLVQNSEEGFRTHREIGRTAAGTSVRIHPTYLDADVRIVVSEVTYHYFAGYGGASKMIFPGLADPEGASRNHRLAVHMDGSEPASSWNEACGPGRIDDNPVARDITEAAALAPGARILVADPVVPRNPDPNKPRAHPVRVFQSPPGARQLGADSRADRVGGGPSAGRVGGDPSADRVGAGAPRESIDPVSRARDSLRSRAQLVFTRAPDLLIADSGGSPRDATFLQAHKSLQHAIRFVPRGGAVLWIARCNEGFCSRQLEALAEGWSLAGDEQPDLRREEARASSSEDRHSLHLQTLCALRHAVEHARVALWSDLPAQQVRRLGIEPLATESEAREWSAHARGRFWGWLPRAERFIPASGWRGGGLD